MNINQTELEEILNELTGLDKAVLIAVDKSCNSSFGEKGAHQPIHLILKKLDSRLKSLKQNKKLIEKSLNELIKTRLVEKKQTSEPSYYLTKLGWMVADELKKEL